MHNKITAPLHSTYLFFFFFFIVLQVANWFFGMLGKGLERVGWVWASRLKLWECCCTYVFCDLFIIRTLSCNFFCWFYYNNVLLRHTSNLLHLGVQAVSFIRALDVIILVFVNDTMVSINSYPKVQGAGEHTADILTLSLLFALFRSWPVVWYKIYGLG